MSRYQRTVGEKGIGVLFAWLVSLVFNPLFLAPVVLVYLIVSQPDHQQFSYTLLFLVLLFYTLIPLIILSLFLIRDRVDSLEVHTRSLRHAPFYWGVLSYTLGLIMIFMTKGYQGLVPAAAVALLVSSLASAAFTYKWKISIHVAGITIAVVFLLYAESVNLSGTSLYLSFLAGFLLIASMIWSRVTLEAHHAGECLAGFALGLTISVAVLGIYPL